MAHHLRERYQADHVPALMKEFGLDNPMQVPKLEKIVVNVGVGEALDNAKALDSAVEDIATITGQRPVVTKARKSIANFKLREGRSIGLKVTLRGERMWSFYDRLVNVALPRTRDFRGVSPNSFDGRGNYTLGVREQLIFPEIVYDKIDKIRGFEVSIITTAPDDEQGRRLLQLLGMPFRRSEPNV
ncbi:MAG: 50S ribosomal protein L5 [Chloroflexi bacterium RBG_19FT_COMBO_62_14]|uniref:Large ribosomal subunit protein uL5 n=2 Tax=environmental samples TaxID=58229 RepID=A0A0H4T9V5_9CHLR|nr:50S ribosomal protein L5, large subunit ribosomal protein L5 [uncultured Chloroflexi bacterium Rifle_16ft_4_minimus_38099]AKQ05178.1 50S ribosomal protein L5, large subunit ribosomal protein L5 [uncultured Chloroflexi bacterium Rifle_16ft_4_minimus_28854]OGO69177.1 MAG: 50S ribosomal protein L5 [Chloroflexi bacterium RBG_19FT_COMBO_62_14]